MIAISAGIDVLICLFLMVSVLASFPVPVGRKHGCLDVFSGRHGCLDVFSGRHGCLLGGEKKKSIHLFSSVPKFAFHLAVSFAGQKLFS